MYGYCVGVVGINPEYFLDEMSQDETQSIYKATGDHNRESWEQTRLICFYSFVSQHGNKEIKTPKDLFPLYWDEKVVEKPKIEQLTREEFLNKAKLIK